MGREQAAGARDDGGPERRNLRSITALRGIAALAVLALHGVAAPLGARAPSFLFRGDLGVDLFFVLSGFVLSHVYGETFSGKASTGAILQYLRARLARIYPVHFVILVLCLPGLGTSPAFSSEALLYNLLLLQGPELSYGSWYGFSWSISAEWHAYLLFPLAAGALLRRSWAGALTIAAACLAVLAVSTVPEQGTITGTHGILGLIRICSEFFAGVCVYRLFDLGWMQPIFARDGVAILSAMLILGLAWTPSPPDILIVLLLPVLLLAVAQNAGAVRRILASRPLLFIGEISYSLYMAQALTRLFQGVVPLTPAAPAGVVAAEIVVCLAVTVAFGIALHRYVEAPCRALLAGRTRSLRPVSPAS